MADPTDSSAGLPEALSHYRLGRELGRGGMGAVYQGTDMRDGSTVAVKVLNPELADDEAYRERFEREAHVAVLLRSPYTVHLLGYGFEAGRYFLVMDYVEGQSLREALRGGPLPPDRAFRIAMQVAQALEEADARGVVHRDIKPDNIMLGPNDSARVLDFGIARQAGALTLTVPGGFVGSLAYASPEHAEGTTDHRSDLYSLGVTFYHMLAGQPPFRGDILEILRHHRTTAPPEAPLAAVPAAVAAVVLRCLEKDPDRRYQTAMELAEALSEAARSLAVPAPKEEEEQPPAGSDAAARAATVVEPPPTEVEPPPTVAHPAAAAAVSVTLGSPTVPRRIGIRTRAADYGLVFRNDRDQPVGLRLAASDPGNRCTFSLPKEISVAARSETTATLRVGPRGRRWRGKRQTQPFVVSAHGDDGGPPITTSGQFEDRPSGCPPYAGGAVLAVAVLIPVLMSGGDEMEEPPPTVVEAPPTVVEAPPTVVEPSPTEVEPPSTKVEPPSTEVEPPSTEVEPPSTEVEPPPLPSSPDVNGPIAFVSDRDGNDEIYVRNADGSDIRRLTDDPALDGHPAWSPDGRRISFDSNRDDNFEIYAMNADGSSLTRLTENSARDFGPAWSPDGRQIAFASDRDGDGDFEIYVMNADGSGTRPLTDHPDTDFEPAWSPDGSRIVFVSDRDGDFEIHVMNADGSDNRRFTDNTDFDSEPAWSPDGLQIAFISDRDGDFEIYVMNADGSGTRPLTDHPGSDSGPAWSTDGVRLAFASNSEEDVFDIYVVNAGGSEIRRLTDADGESFQPAWAPTYAAGLRSISAETASQATPLIDEINSGATTDAVLENIRRLGPEVLRIQVDAVQAIAQLPPPPEFAADHQRFLDGLRVINGAQQRLIDAAEAGDVAAVAAASAEIADLSRTLEADLSPEYRELVAPFFE